MIVHLNTSSGRWMGGHLAFASLALTALGPVFPTGLPPPLKLRRAAEARSAKAGRLDDVEKRWRQLDVSEPRERGCSFRCSPVWVISSFRRVLSPDDDHVARSRPVVNTGPIALRVVAVSSRRYRHAAARSVVGVGPTYPHPPRRNRRASLTRAQTITRV
jgi:hypothetical protein